MTTSAPTSPVRKSRYGLVRPFERGDVAAISRLFDRVFLHGPGRSSSRLEAFIQELFFDAPVPCVGWAPPAFCRVGRAVPASSAPNDVGQSPTYASYVYEDERGNVGGFLGVHPRTLMLDGRRVLAAAWGQFMVAPELRGRGMALRLTERFFRGGQELSFSGSANTSARAINKRLGGINPKSRGLSWRKTLRPVRALARRVGRAVPAFCVPNDVGQSPKRQRGIWTRHAAVTRTLAGASGSDLCGTLAHGDLDAIETVYERAFAGARFHPAFEPDQMAWKLRIAASSNRPGTIARVVKTEAGPVGWYVWFLGADGAATVVELLCAAGHHNAVVKHLLTHARAAGAETISGLCHDEAETQAVRSAGASVWQAQSTFIFHSCNPHLLETFPNGPQHVSLFDGEGWIDFPRVS